MDNAGPAPKQQEETDQEGIKYTISYGDLYVKDMHHLRQLNFIA